MSFLQNLIKLVSLDFRLNDISYQQDQNVLLDCVSRQIQVLNGDPTVGERLKTHQTRRSREYYRKQLIELIQKYDASQVSFYYGQQKI